MITADGNFMKQDDFEEIVRNAEIVEVICPRCREMTRTEDLGHPYYLCLECGTVFSVEDKLIK